MSTHTGWPRYCQHADARCFRCETPLKNHEPSGFAEGHGAHRGLCTSVGCAYWTWYDLRPMRVLVACEYSGVVRDAFIAAGHDAMSCDLLPTEVAGPHYQGSVLDVLADPDRFGRFDLMIAHPPCTHLAVSGARWFKDKLPEQAEALAFVAALLAAPVPRIALENPVSIISTRIRKPTQTIQPWQHGHGEVKRTCLWLKGLPKLVPSNVVDGRDQRVWRMGPSPDRWKERSRTLPGIAAAMAAQWGRP